MSNGIQYDSLLVRYLAEELAASLADRPVRGVGIDRERLRAVLALEDAALVWELHPERGWLRRVPSTAPPEDVPVHHRATVGRIDAPRDERILTIDIDSPGRSVRQARRIVVELMTNQWNVLALSREGRILAALRPRRAGDRALLPGHPYETPEPTGRRRPTDVDGWRALLADVPPAERARELVRRVAYTGPVSAAAILGEAAREEDDRALADSFARYADVVAFPPPAPRVVRFRERLQPYPIPLHGLDGEEADSLLAAMARAADSAVSDALPALPPELLDRLRRRVRKFETRVAALGDELEGAQPEADALRRRADLLLSQLHRIQKGAEEVRLDDLQGGHVTVEMDPALSPTENAKRLYDAAQKRERAAERLPSLIAEARRERDALGAVLERAQRGEATREEVEASAGPPPEETGKGAREPDSLPPYRRYETSSGLEARVGRNRKANDDLTFHHSSPDDVWLHARDVAGSHVILRWQDSDANPPSRDLHEAAVLAAVNSRARTSGTVPVDWTRRKYVRKPRKAPPGLVVPDRVQTVFVEPNERVERRMRRGD